jgi:F-type H+-transporting ATPase subunit gamma
MPRINEIKEQQEVVTTVGSFTNSLQQIAAMRMVKLRDLVLASRRFVDEATVILRELQLERAKMLEKELGKKSKRKATMAAAQKTVTSINTNTDKHIDTAIIVVTSDQGLCGSYNLEIFRKLDAITTQYPNADYFVMGHKGQHYLEQLKKKVQVKYYPYNIPEAVTIKDLKPLIGMFYYYQHIFLVYSKYINTATRDVTFIELAVPNISASEAEKEKAEGKYIFEPGIEDLIASISARVRYALFRQQILDSKLSLYTSQMMAMKTAADNAQNLLVDLQREYNKARRKIVDKKILEVQSGRSLWEEA